ncbi:MAG: TonB C-terminal domain-containing protein [Bradyrhizobium sp.]|nr:TonB C-terminal domain-containing protein [Bradyrhizobium sp.]
MARRGKPALWFAAALLALPMPAVAEPLDSIKDLIQRLQQCWKPPPRAKPMDITVIVSFNREGAILGRPRVTYETEGSSDDDRLAYRVAAMEALQRCTPLPFSEGLGGAVAGRPFAIRFWSHKTPPKPSERRAWLTPKIL